MKRLLPVAIAIALSTPAFGAPETFVIDNNHTNPSFSYSHFGFSVQTARFNRTSGKIVLDRAAKTGSVNVVIDITSVDTISPKLNEHLQKPDFFDSAKYPTAAFQSTSVSFDGDKPLSIDGNLTMKGVTKPVTLKVTGYKLGPNPLSKKDEIGANATTTVKRSDFGLDLYAPGVSDEVTISIAVEAAAQ